MFAYIPIVHALCVQIGVDRVGGSRRGTQAIAQSCPFFSLDENSRSIDGAMDLSQGELGMVVGSDICGAARYFSDASQKI